MHERIELPPHFEIRVGSVSSVLWINHQGLSMRLYEHVVPQACLNAGWWIHAAVKQECTEWADVDTRLVVASATFSDTGTWFKAKCMLCMRHIVLNRDEVTVLPSVRHRNQMRLVHKRKHTRKLRCPYHPDHVDQSLAELVVA